jgi:CBS domain-containing protein
MLAGSLATLIADLLSPESVYTMPLIRKGINLVRSAEVDMLETVTVGEVMSQQETVRSDMPIDEARRILEEHRHHGTAVVDDGRLVGVLSMSDILRARDAARVADVMTARPVTVTEATPVSEALERMAALGVSRLPVVAAADPDRLVGMFRRGDAVNAYHRALGAAKGAEMAKARQRRRAEPGVSFFEVQVPPGSHLDGRLVKEVPWPEGCTVVSVRRGTLVLVPKGDTRLHVGDVITAFGTPSAKKALVARLNAGADEPTAEIPVFEPPE